MRFPTLALLLLIAAHPAFAADAIGTVDRVQGSAEGVTSGVTQALAGGAAIFLDEVVSTGDGARLALAFNDGTTLTLGEHARATLDQFVYQPAGKSSLHADVAGAFRYISGKLAPGATREASVTTPVATIGVRGTDFWGGPIDSQFGVVLLEGAVTVTTAGGSADLDAVGQGVNIAGTTPSAVMQWPQEKRQRALATVAFQ